MKKQGKIKSIMTDAKISAKFTSEEKRWEKKYLQSLSSKKKVEIVEDLIKVGEEILKVKKR